jgi:hypothetical protein
MNDITVDFASSLSAIVNDARLNPDNLTVALKSARPGHVEIGDRHSILVFDGNNIATWPVPSLRDLFRGDRQPPPDMDHYPTEYCPSFYFIEKHFLRLCAGIGDRTDQEMEEIYSTLRRRPDGRSLGSTHDFMWQVAALLLGRSILSEAEFDALLGALVRSTRKWSQRPVSRNYAAYLRNTFEQGDQA